MTIPKANKHKDYARYGMHCLDMSASGVGPDSSAILRDMALEWLKLADAELRPASQNRK